MTTVEELSKQRATLKGQITKIGNYINLRALIENDVTNVDKKEEDLDAIFEKFEEIQTKMEPLKNNVNEASIEAKDQEFETHYWDVKNAISTVRHNILHGDQSKEPGNAANDVIKSLVQALGALQTNPNPRVRVPELKLPTFSGDPNDCWTTFYELFESVIHKESKYQNIEKYTYLCSCLSDELKRELTSKFKLSNEGYDLAIKYLQDKYGKKRPTTIKHLSELFKVKSIEKENYKDLHNLVNCYSANIEQARRINPGNDLFDLLIIFMVSSRLDDSTRRAWELQIKDEENPTWNQMRKFLEDRVAFLQGMNYERQCVTSNESKSKPIQKPKTNIPFVSRQSISTAMSGQTFNISCGVCKGEHKTHNCPELLSIDVAGRHQKIKALRLCYNCLGSHNKAECTSKYSCRECVKIGKPNERHHSLLHIDKPQPTTNSQNNHDKEPPKKEPITKQSETQSNQAFVTAGQNHVFLLTAIVNIQSQSGEWIPCRALLDSGSQSSFITESLAQNLGISRQKIDVLVHGIGEKPLEVKTQITTAIKSRVSDYSKSVKFLVVSKLSNRIPNEKIEMKSLKLPSNITLADPNFLKPTHIDILIGGELFLDLIEDGKIQFNKSEVYLRSSVFGWLVAGKIPAERTDQACYSIQTFASTTSNLDQMVRQFWELENVENVIQMSEEEKYCEDLFKKTTERDNDGRFVVMLPTRENFNQLLDNIPNATKSLHYLEKRLEKNENHYNMYRDFMREYEEMNHMKEIDAEEKNPNEKCFYMPHHAVLKPSSTTTKLRVVFNASSKASNNLSLNDTICVGPVVQRDLFSTWIQFRIFRYAMTADAKMMYRQIMIHPSQQRVQRILWRENSTQKAKHFAMLTVTYGTGSGSFHATRCLKQLALENQEKHPEAAKIIETNMYMDDLLTGSQSIEEAKKLQKEIIDIMKSAKFHLRKWVSNDPEVLSNIPHEDKEKLENSKEMIKALGLNWNPATDKLSLNVKSYHPQESSTKRTVLADIATFFDPLGLESPVIVAAKILLQHLWELELDWDEKIPAHLHEGWQKFRHELSTLNSLEIDRFVATVNFVELQMHGFCDASEAAYGACVYIVSKDQNNEVESKLLCAKSKVAPLKKRTLPELELCGAELLSKLIQKVKSAIKQEIQRTVLWTDSSIVLAWIKNTTNKYKVFVANRLASIKRNSEDAEWRHVRTHQNPADHISRGLMPKQLMENDLWWSGPEFLKLPENEWPNQKSNEKSTVENSFLNQYLMTSSTENQEKDAFQLVKKFSSTGKMTRVLAYVYRFCTSTRTKDKTQRLQGPLKVSELTHAFNSIVKSVQTSSFNIEIKELNESNTVHNNPRKPKISKRSVLQPLNPFIDAKGLLRVGGRIDRSTVSYNSRHPIILPSQHPITTQLLRDIHLENAHPGQRAMLSIVRQKFWPIRAKVLIKRTIAKCIRCTRARPSPIQQYMGDLPEHRVTLQFPFYNTGVDYCGPFYIKSGMVRSRTLLKGYVAVFVYLATKAIHLELVSDMSTDAFVAALDRFYSLHGLSAKMFSDNGPNFVGTAAELERLQREMYSEDPEGFKTLQQDMGELRDFLSSKNLQDKVSTRDSLSNIQWHFIPPHAPEFGGLWESAVKSTKFHIVRQLGKALLTFEEFDTILKKISAILNSRPLFAESDDVNDYSALTPAHFLIGRPMNSKPEEDVSDIDVNRLDRWRRLQKITQQFFKSWSQDYLHCLQQRTKRFKEKFDVKVGDLVLMVEDNMKPMKWPLGRIVAVHPGIDQITRVVTVKNQNGVYKRPVNKICLLPVESQDFQGGEYV